ncbi:unnamed protein product [Cercopithifilaria johnstoni]|uniref:Peptidase A1 domain-containing protein n=1 Tax=Cercopithifilaria johnstoni TaxID=2874296 RepID=A0A8J2LSR1_9BILA|nr:unnamed protein product [Cercopithifilaria johnstoni]
MKDTLINLAIIICCLHVTMIFAEFQVELHPVYSESNQHIGYTANVMIGEPKKEFSLLLDTVTNFLWVLPSTFILSYPNGTWEFMRKMHAYAYYDAQTCNETNEILLDQAYGSRKVSLIQFTDNISFNPLNGTRVDFPSSPICVAKILQWPKFDYQKMDGVLGLSTLHVFGSPFGVSTQSFSGLSILDNQIRRAIRNNQLDPVITIALPPLDSKKKAMLTFGGRNNQSCDLNYETTEPLRLKYEATELLRLNYDSNRLIRLICENAEPLRLSDFIYSFVKSKQSANHYEFKYNSIKMGNATSSIKSFAYPNTIEPYIGVPDEFLRKIVENLNATFDSSENKYKVQCEGSVVYNTYEPFEIFTDRNTYVVPPQNFIIKRNPDDTLCELAFKRSERTTYSSYLSGIPVELYEDNDPNTVVLGIPFFHQYCITLIPRDYVINFAPII